MPFEYPIRISLYPTSSNPITESQGNVTANPLLSDDSGNYRISASILPFADNVFNLGSPTMRWARLYSTASVADTATTASYALTSAGSGPSDSASFATSASYAQTASVARQALTASRLQDPNVAGTNINFDGGFPQINYAGVMKLGVGSAVQLPYLSASSVVLTDNSSNLVTTDIGTGYKIVHGNTFNDPEGHIIAGAGSLYSYASGINTGSLYFKLTGSGNTGWIPVIATDNQTLSASWASSSLFSISSSYVRRQGADIGSMIIDVGNASNSPIVAGYNQLPYYILDIPAEPGLSWVIEPNYDDGSGHNKMEGYLQYISSSGDQDTVRRPFISQIDRRTGNITQTCIAGGIGANGAVVLGITDGNGTAGERASGHAILTVTSESVAITPFTSSNGPARLTIAGRSGTGDVAQIAFGDASSGHSFTLAQQTSNVAAAFKVYFGATEALRIKNNCVYPNDATKYFNGAGVYSAITSSISASFATSASYAPGSGNSATASYALTASYVENAQTASYVATSLSSQTSISSSYAATASWATNVEFTSSVAETASYISGSAYFSDAVDNYVVKWLDHTLAGTSSILDKNSSITMSAPLLVANIYGNINGTASNATTASYALNASAGNAASSSWASASLSASYALSSSRAMTASYALSTTGTGSVNSASYVSGSFRCNGVDGYFPMYRAGTLTPTSSIQLVGTTTHVNNLRIDGVMLLYNDDNIYGRNNADTNNVPLIGLNVGDQVSISDDTHVTVIGKECIINGTFIRLGGSGGPLWAEGTGDPEGVLAAPVGSFFSRTNGGTGSSWYVKETGGSTSSGWVAK